MASVATPVSFPAASWGGARAGPRRLLLVLGSSFLDKLWRMASGTVGRSLTFSNRPQQGVSTVLKNVEWPATFPFKDEDFSRFDESADSLFYIEPRFVTHIDDPAISALTKYYYKVFPPNNTPGVCLLDLCSSWVSHYPAGFRQVRIVGMGMNEDELKRNPVSVDYLIKPIDVFKEMQRILKPDGLAIISFSNRCFWTKAISIWTSTGDAEHAVIVGSYFHYAGGFEPPVPAAFAVDFADFAESFLQALDISPNGGRTDPMFVVYSRKKASA